MEEVDLYHMGQHLREPTENRRVARDHTWADGQAAGVVGIAAGRAPGLLD